MKRTSFGNCIKTILLAVIAVAAVLGNTSVATAETKSAAAKKKPNLLFIFIDDMGWRDVGFMGTDFFETPNIDQLASEGMIFTNAYSCAANCAPARACLLSGQYTPRHEIYNVGTRPRGNPKHRRLQYIPGTNTLDPSIKTWAKTIQDAGYTTATIGKWHLSRNPLPYGFDVNIGGTHSGVPPKGYYPPHNNVPGLENAPKGEYLTDRLSDEADQFIRANKDRPWLLYLTHFAIHTPLNAKKELIAKYKSKPPGKLHDNVALGTMIQSVDDGIGKIRATLEELGIADNTIIVFFSDNGGFIGATDMAPLRGYKGTYYEGGIREPFFVKWPGVVKPGTVSEEPIIGVDLYPTFCEMLGVEMPKGQIADGKSIVPLLTGEVETFGNRPLFWHFPAYLEMGEKVRRGKNDIESRDPLFRTRPCGIVRVGDWKLHQYFEDNGLELYNLKNDIGETTNLAEKMPKKTKELLSIMEHWRNKTNAPVPTKPNPKFNAKAEAKAIANRK